MGRSVAEQREVDEERRSNAARTVDAKGSPDSLDAILQTDQPGPACRIGAADTESTMASAANARLASRPTTRCTSGFSRGLERPGTPKVRVRPMQRVGHNPRADVVLTVKRGKARVLRQIVRHANLPAPVRRMERWSSGPGAGRVTLRILNASSFPRRLPGDAKPGRGGMLWIYSDLELRPAWAERIINGLVRRRLPYQHQI